MWYLCLIFLLFIGCVQAKDEYYYRMKGEGIIPSDKRDFGTIDDLHTLHVGFVDILKGNIGEHINWILNQVLYKLHRPVRVSSVGIKNLKTWNHPNSIIITYSSLNWYYSWLESNQRQNLNVSVIHLGDEACDQDYSFYTKAPFVLRNYYCEEVLRNHKNAYFLPLGWITPPDNFARRKPLFSHDRSYDFNFVGTKSDDRSVIENLLSTYGILENYPSNFVSQPKSLAKDFFWMDQYPYNGYMSQSKLGIVPGNSTRVPGNETARLYEAMSGGAIPLAFSGDFLLDGLFGGNTTAIPFPVVKNWRRELMGFIQKAHHDESWSDAVQYAMSKWWNSYIIHMQGVFTDLVDKTLGTHR